MIISLMLPFIFPTAMAAAAVAAAMFATFLFFIYYKLLNTTKTATPPPPPVVGGAWPVIGHLRLLRGPQPPHITFGNLADKYGPIFTLKLGVHRYLIVSNSEVAKECLSTQDKALASRPKSLATEILGYNYTTFGFTPYGPLWRTLRKISVQQLLSSHRLQFIKNVCDSEVRASIKQIVRDHIDLPNKTCDMKKWFGNASLNVMFGILIGRPFVAVGAAGTAVDDEEAYRETIRDYFELAGKFVVSDSLPFLRWLDIGGYERAMKKTMKDLDGALQGWLEEHNQKGSGSGGEIDDQQDFMDIMLADIHNHEELSNYDSDALIKATCLTLILAGSDTVSVTLTWALSLLLNNPNIMHKAQQELDTHVGRERQIQESDMKKLVYLQAIIKETLRMYPPGPLLLPHESMEDCTIWGYHVPAGTRVLVNASKIHRDQRTWSNPSEFNPDRFLTTHKNVDVKGQNFEFIPFGSGRRMCPGINLAMELLQLALASLLQGFEISKPSNEPIDMTESIGVTNMKSTPLEVFLKSRLLNY